MPTVPGYPYPSPGSDPWTLGDVFTELGHLFFIIQELNTYVGTTLPAQVVTASDDYTGGDQKVIDSFYANLANFQQTPNGYLSTIQQVCNKVIITNINEAMNLIDNKLFTGLFQLIISMINSSKTVQKNTVSASSATANAVTGNPVVVLSVLDGNGASLENSFDEYMLATCTADAQTGGVTVFREPFSIQALPAAPGPQTAFAWPAGSGASLSISCVDAFQEQTAGTGNNLKNGSFEVWTVPNVPDGWHVDVGVAGTDILQSAVVFYDGIFSLSYVGDGSTLTSLYQGLTTELTVGDTSVRALPNTQLALNCFIKVDVVPAAGILEIALTDETGTIIKDNSGVDNKITKTLSAATTSFVALNGTFRIPRVLPTEVRLRVRLSTALSAGSVLFIDRMAMSVMSQLYLNGPSVSMFSGDVGSIVFDMYKFTIVNDYAGKLQCFFNRVFSMRQLNLQLPSSGSPNIPDSVIT